MHSTIVSSRGAAGSLGKIVATRIRRRTTTTSIHSPTTRCFSWKVDLDTGLISSTQQKQQYQTIIGLEVHAQLDIATKLFSGSSLPRTIFQGPNTCVWPLDIATPGVLPRLSLEAVQAAVLSAAALKCDIPTQSRFERKHYFYADIPLGYQVTQQRWPLAKDGRLECQRDSQGSTSKKAKKKYNDQDSSFSVRIERIQLEQDTGKTILATTRQDETESLVDFNRAGSALIEIVFAPDLRSAREAATAVETLRNLLKHIGTCNGKMEEGSLRCDLNVSIAQVDDMNGDDVLSRAGSRVEVKNLNSLRQILKAAEYEAIRQVKQLQEGEPTSQETRTYDVKSGRTKVIRTKEEAKDYRFMPEPDLPPIVLDQDTFDGVTVEAFLEEKLPELPDEARKRLVEEYNLSEYLANVVTGDLPAIKLLDDAIEAACQSMDEQHYKRIPDAVANFLCNEVFALVRERQNEQKHDGTDGDDSAKSYSVISGTQLGELVVLKEEGNISNTMAKQILQILYNEEPGKSPRQIADERGFRLITDKDTLAQFCRQAIEANPAELEKYKQGGKFARKMIKFFVGKSMAASRGNAHPERLSEVLEEVLGEIAPGVEQ
jgi:aspartyl-tRNA(Asn)/glutamyl-tRNA(Gln) amidotransferase subunit B